MSSFIQNIKLNSLQEQINNIEQELSTFNGIGTGNISYTLNLNNNALVNAKSISFNDGSSFSHANFLSVSGTLFSLDMNGKNISNVNNLSINAMTVQNLELTTTNDILIWNNDTVITSNYLTTNGYLNNPLLSDLDLNEHDLTAVSQIYLSNGVVFQYGTDSQEYTTLNTTDGNNLIFNSQTLLSESNYGNFVNSLDTLTLNSMTIKGVNVLTDLQQTLTLNTDNRLVIDNNVIVIDSDLSSYIQPSDISNVLSTTNLSQVNIIDASNNVFSINASDNNLLLNGNTILTSGDGYMQPSDISNALLSTNILQINITDSDNHIFSINASSNELYINGNTFITTGTIDNNIESYLSSNLDSYLFSNNITKLNFVDDLYINFTNEQNKLLKKYSAFNLCKANTYYRIRKDSLQSYRFKALWAIWRINKEYNNMNLFKNLSSLFFISLNSLKKYGLR